MPCQVNKLLETLSKQKADPTLDKQSKVLLEELIDGFTKIIWHVNKLQDELNALKSKK